MSFDDPSSTSANMATGHTCDLCVCVCVLLGIYRDVIDQYVENPRIDVDHSGFSYHAVPRLSLFGCFLGGFFCCKIFKMSNETQPQNSILPVVCDGNTDSMG